MELCFLVTGHTPEDWKTGNLQLLLNEKSHKMYCGKQIIAWLA